MFPKLPYPQEMINYHQWCGITQGRIVTEVGEISDVLAAKPEQVAFKLTPDDPFTAVVIDGALNYEYVAYIRGVVFKADSYTEEVPPMSGVKTIVSGFPYGDWRSPLLDHHEKGAKYKVAIYTNSGIITIGSNPVLYDCPINKANDVFLAELEKIVLRYHAQRI